MCYHRNNLFEEQIAYDEVNISIKDRGIDIDHDIQDNYFINLLQNQTQDRAWGFTFPEVLYKLIVVKSS
jgi:hypothetical protein